MCDPDAYNNVRDMYLNKKNRFIHDTYYKVLGWEIYNLMETNPKALLQRVIQHYIITTY